MRTLPITAVVHEGPMARAYLGMLHFCGWRLRCLVLLVHGRDMAGGQAVAPWLPLAWRQRWARRLQDLRMNHWSRDLLRREGGWLTPWLQHLCRQYQLPAEVVTVLTAAPAFERFAEFTSELLIDGLNDPALATHLQGFAHDTPGLLFTGGGLLREPLINLPGKRWLHVHPGHLPQVRGADGLLWSVLLRGTPGATVFYMAPGLDTGDIILAQDLPSPALPAAWPTLDDAFRYKLLYAFVDPLLRAAALRSTLEQPTLQTRLAQGRSDQLPAQPQAEGEGQTFRFMHPRLRRVAFERLWQLQATPPSAPSGAVKT